MKSKTMKAGTIGMALGALMIGLFFLPAGMSAQMPAQKTGAGIRVLSSDGMEPAMRDLTPRIETKIGRKLNSQFDSSKKLADKIQAGEGFDVAILTTSAVDDLIKQGKIAAGGHAEISRTGMGIGVRAGAPKPDISTPEALKRTLLNAKSISFNPTGASAAHTYDMLARLGITEAIKPKLMLDAEAGRPQMNVAGGKAELVISLIPEIRFFPGVDLVGPVTSEFQSYVNFAGGIATNAQDKDAAKALIQFITGPGVVPVLKAKGMEPR